MTKVAMLGTGKMGGAIARKLKAGRFEIRVWDRTKTKAEALNVGPVADSPADAVRDADVVVSSLTGPEAVREVYFGQGGVFETAAGKLVVEMSTTGPAIGEELARAASLNGVKLVQAPVIGSVPAVESGTLIILASAERADDVDLARPVLEQLGEVKFVGAVGAAPVLKLIANSMLGIVNAAAGELLVAGTRHGLDPDLVFWVLTRIAPGLKVRETGFLTNVHAPVMFAVRDMLKDLDLGLSIYQPPTPLTLIARRLFGEVAARTPGLDVSAIISAFARETAR